MAGTWHDKEIIPQPQRRSTAPWRSIRKTLSLWQSEAEFMKSTATLNGPAAFMNAPYITTPGNPNCKPA
jgi:hypothetical protein